MARILIVEDEVLIADNIAYHLEALGHTSLGPAKNYDSALALIRAELPDLILMDIRIKGEKSGIDLAKTINLEFSIPFVFLTAFSDSATVSEAKDCFPAGFIRKPFGREDLFVGLEIGLNQKQKPKSAHILLKNGTQKELVLLDDILYLKADRVYVSVVTRLKTIVLRQSMGDFLNLLPDRKFLRTHRSYAVNADKITGMTSSTVLLENESIPLGKKFQDVIQNWLRQGQ